eukprot:UN5012
MRPLGSSIKGSLIPSLIFVIIHGGACAAVAYFLEEKTGLKYASAADLKLVAIGVPIYFCVLYLFIFRQGLGKNVLNASLATSDDPAVRAHFTNLNRTALNAIEQAPFFLGTLLPYAGLVNGKRAGILCLAYTAFLLPYPGLYGRSFSPKVFVSTLPRYLIVFYMAGASVIAALRT